MKNKVLVLFVLLISFYSYSQNVNQFNPKTIKLDNNFGPKNNSNLKSNISDTAIQESINSYYGIEKAKNVLIQQIKNVKNSQSDLEKFKMQNKVKEEKTEKSNSIAFVELKKPDLLKKKNKFQFKDEIFSKKIELKSLKLKDSIF